MIKSLRELWIWKKILLGIMNHWGKNGRNHEYQARFKWFRLYLRIVQLMFCFMCLDRAQLVQRSNYRSQVNIQWNVGEGKLMMTMLTDNNTQKERNLTFPMSQSCRWPFFRYEYSTTTSSKRSPPISDRQSKTPKFCPSKPYSLNLW